MKTYLGKEDEDKHHAKFEESRAFVEQHRIKLGHKYRVGLTSFSDWLDTEVDAHFVPLANASLPRGVPWPEASPAAGAPRPAAKAWSKDGPALEGATVGESTTGSFGFHMRTEFSETMGALKSLW